MALNPFKRKPTTDIATLRTRRDEFAEEHADAQRRIEAKREIITDLRIERAEAAVITKAQSALFDAERDARETGDAIARLDSEIARKLAEQAEAEDQKVRAQTVGLLAKHESAVNDAATNLIAALNHFATVTDEIAPTVIDAQHINTLTKRLADEFPSAVALVTSMIRHHAENVKAGVAPSKLREPEPVRVRAPAAPKPDVTGVMAVRNIAWHEGSMIRRHPRGFLVTLPVELAEHAIKLRAALPPGHHEAAQLSNSPNRSRDIPSLRDCITLDAASAKEKAAEQENDAAPLPQAAQAEPNTSQRFQVIDRGPAYPAAIASR